MAALAVHAWWGTSRWLNNVLWSVYCEIIYYAIYPLLRLLMARFGSQPVLAASFVISWLFCLIIPDTGYGHIIAYGHLWTWLVCLPVWLCGCVLAEWLAYACAVPRAVERISTWLGRRLSLARWGVWAASSVLLVFGMEEWLPFKYSLPVFGAGVLVWFLAEMRPPDKDSWLARWGSAGYSIYLIHPIAESGGFGDPVWAGTAPLLGWVLRIALVAGASALFYFLIEKPSHKLARTLGRVQLYGITVPHRT